MTWQPVYPFPKLPGGYSVLLERRSDDDLAVTPPRYRAILIASVSGPGETKYTALAALADKLEAIARNIRAERARQIDEDEGPIGIHGFAGSLHKRKKP